MRKQRRREARPEARYTAPETSSGGRGRRERNINRMMNMVRLTAEPSIQHRPLDNAPRYTTPTPDHLCHHTLSTSRGSGMVSTRLIVGSSP